MSNSKKKPSTRDRIIECAEQHFGTRVVKVDAPGGSRRSSFRLQLKDRQIIGTLRPNFRRTHLEAHVLGQIGQYCDDLPECLGVVGHIMFQSDVGERRLNVEIARVKGEDRTALAAESVAAIFRIQSAARKTNLNEMAPHLGNHPEWVTHFVDAIDFLQDLGGGISKKFDRRAAYERVATEPRQFVKWDCRSGNAALDTKGKLRWFDFEYCGLRHGAEDLAWLIGDESWPLRAQDMVDIVIDAFDPDCGIPIEDYLDFLSVYVTFHCVQRLKMIVEDSEDDGWLSKEYIRKYDKAGVNPEFAAQLCRVGAYFAAQSPITAPLSRNFTAALNGFLHIVRQEARAELRRA